jgi:hypothetical protein
MERSSAAMAAAISAREKIAATLERTEENRRRNHRLRSSLSEVRASLETARIESRRIREGLPTCSAHGET